MLEGRKCGILVVVVIIFHVFVVLLFVILAVWLDWFRALLRGNWSEAVELIMKPREGGQFCLFTAHCETYHLSRFFNDLVNVDFVVCIRRINTVNSCNGCDDDYHSNIENIVIDIITWVLLTSYKFIALIFGSRFRRAAAPTIWWNSLLDSVRSSDTFHSLWRHLKTYQQLSMPLSSKLQCFRLSFVFT